MKHIDAISEMNRAIAEWIGPQLAAEIEAAIGHQVMNKVEKRSYTMGFEIRNYNGGLVFVMRSLVDGEERTDYVYPGDATP
jgi:hypothetical protein